MVEEAIKANEARIRNIINNMMVGLIIITRDGLIESINPRTESMFSTRSHEIAWSPRHVAVCRCAPFLCQ